MKYLFCWAFSKDVLSSLAWYSDNNYSLMIIIVQLLGSSFRMIQIIKWYYHNLTSHSFIFFFLSIHAAVITAISVNLGNVLLGSLSFVPRTRVCFISSFFGQTLSVFLLCMWNHRKMEHSKAKNSMPYVISLDIKLADQFRPSSTVIMHMYGFTVHLCPTGEFTSFLSTHIMD